MKKINRRRFLLSSYAVLITASGFSYYKISKKSALKIDANEELIKNGQAPILSGTLLKRGLSQQEVAKILGGTFF